MSSYCKSLTKLENQIVLFEKEQEHYEEALLAKDLLIESQTNKIRELGDQVQRLALHLNTERGKLDLLLEQWEDTLHELNRALKQSRSSSHNFQQRALTAEKANRDLLAEVAILREKNEQLVRQLSCTGPVQTQEPDITAAEVTCPDPGTPDSFLVESALYITDTLLRTGSSGSPDFGDSMSEDEFPSFRDEDAICSAFMADSPVIASGIQSVNASATLLADDVAASYDEELRELRQENDRLRHLLDQSAFLSPLSANFSATLSPSSSCSPLLAIAGLGPRWFAPVSTSATSIIFFQSPASSATPSVGGCTYCVD
ncbi:HGL243Cp [Eremothecium sinecaudum]|uniref:HGL243Cp n=1 Tax=Eremothecium sinecaudum TaxID=45286 RepID=A0A109UY02_9SACH|nr:HGL243Cp [Eremothecium sinecaudum]AMD22097.1 HGL243Cp [Eremothecium sinecaudum]